MFKSLKFKILTTATIIMLLLTACGTDSANNSAISTAVAQTVAAQNLILPTDTPVPTVIPTNTTGPLQFIATLTPVVPLVLASPTLKPNNGAKSECGKASLVSETIPDGSIYPPGASFTKTWEIKNESTCVWDTSYKIVFWDGDVMGGGYVYNLPQIVSPGVTVPISLVLIAPATDGDYTSKWMLQTPDSTEFGVGEYSAPFYTDIVVSSAKKPDYAIISVDYSVVRSPATGCPANTIYTIYATLTSNGPIKVTYQWLLGSGTPETILENPPKILTFKEAGTQTVSHKTGLHLGATPGNQRWDAIVITDPVYHEYEHFHFNYDCGAY